VLAPATIYEAAVALWVNSAQSPGKDVVVGAAWLALLVGAGGAFVNGSRRKVQAGTPWVLLAPAAAAFVTARYFTFDPYYAPSLRRSSDEGLVSPWLIVALVAVALATAGLTWVRPRLGMGATSAVLILCALAAVAVRLGH